MRFISKSWIMLVLFSGIFSSQAQDKYWVLFTNKDGVSFNPHEYFHPLAIERRIKHNIPLNHYTDRPVREDYLTQVSLHADSIKAVTRWFNGICGYFNSENINVVAKLPFVKEIVKIESQVTLAYENESRYATLMSDGAKKLAKSQISLMGGEYFEDKNFNGKGIRIAIFDAGFPGVDRSTSFSHIRNRNGIKATYDFVKNKEFVYGYNAHGAMTLSCVGGKYGDVKLGMATDSDFLLARTEIASREPYSEEENWLQAAEWADRHGAHIINSSLGYTDKRYFQRDMDGKTSMITRAGNMAASKGILVVNSAGNEGGGGWTIIGAPADADSVLAVGGLNPWTGMHTTFGSLGPTADGRLKPNVCAPAHVIAQGKNEVKEVPGTSFSSPLTAGFAACLLQSNPDMKVMELFAAVEKSGNLYPYFDYAHGYGTPQGDRAMKNLAESKPTFEVFEENNLIRVKINDESFEMIHATFLLYISEEHQNIHIGDESYNSASYSSLPKIPPYFYWHLEDEDGKLLEYKVLNVQSQHIFHKPYEELRKKTIRMHYKGYTYVKTF
ncbi:MAG: S8 family serine peptidase [Flavobacteriales bacterium]